MLLLMLLLDAGLGQHSQQNGQRRRAEETMRHRAMCARAHLLVLLTVCAAPAQAADKLRVGKAVPFAWTFTPIDVGVEVGIFAKHGLALEVTSFAGDARLQQGMVSDS